MGINYSSILSRAWTITWKYKVLWLFGFLVILGGGSGWADSNGGSISAPNFQFQSGFNESGMDRRNIPPEWRSTLDQLAEINLSTWISIAAGVVCCMFLIGLALWLVSILGRGGLIGGINAAETAEKVTFREAWETGLHCFLRLFLIRLLGIVVGIAIVVVLVLPGMFLGILTCGLGCIPLFCVMFLIGIAVDIWFAFMDYAVVVEKLGVGEAIGRAWTVMRDHIGPVIIFYLILFAISLAVGIVMVILFIPSGGLMFLSMLPLITEGGSLNIVLLVIGAVLFGLTILVTTVFQAVYTVWETSVMVLAYREFSKTTPLLSVSTERQPEVSG